MATQSLPQVPQANPTPFPNKQISQGQLEQIISLRNQVSALKAERLSAKAGHGAKNG